MGTSASSWEDAARQAVEIATKTLEDCRIAEVEKLDMTIAEGKVTKYRAKLKLSFKYRKEE